MLTLSELVSKVERAPLTRVKRAPGWKQLRKYGGGIVERAEFGENSFLEVFRKGYVYYNSGSAKTTFSLADVTSDYEYRPLEDVDGAILVLGTELFDNLPWVIRVLMEGEDRVVISQEKSRADLNSVPYDTSREDTGEFGCDPNDPLLQMIREEISEMLYQSFLVMTEYQQHLVEAYVLNNVKQTELADEYEVTKQTINKAIKNGLKAFRESFIGLYNN